MLNKHPEFQALQDHYDVMADVHMRDLFAEDRQRFQKFHLKENGLLLDFSRHRITSETMAYLVDLAKSADIEGWRGKMFSGKAINNTENRAVLHVALRGSVKESVEADGENVPAFVKETLEKIKIFSDIIRKEKRFTDIVNIGIGGSDLGTRTVYEALKPFADGPALHFVPNIDAAALAPLLQKLNPRTTMFIVVSKTFTTLETLANAKTARTWLEKHVSSASNHFAAVTENIKEARAFGVDEDHIFPLRQWIGGRYSVWSAVGMPIALAFGFENFEKFLAGANAMDRHFLNAPLEKNMPVILALLGIWYRNFFGFGAHAVLPYIQNLQPFPSYLQQLDMESNGKRVSREGELLDYATGPVIFGEPGTNSQHSFFQLLHQGSDIIPADFIISKEPSHDLTGHHAPLNGNALAQVKGLMEGKINPAEPHKIYPGNRSSSLIILDRIDPFHLGMLLVLYEHKVFTQGILWNINSFDQWGVELGKTLSKDIIQALEKGGQNDALDDSTTALIAYLTT